MENGNAKERRIAQELELLKQYQRVSVKDLAATLEVSEMTIRRDLDLLRKNHVLERSYGYATLAKGGDGYAYDGEVYDLRLARIQNLSEKDRIAKYAATLIEPGDWIFWIMAPLWGALPHISPQILNLQSYVIILRSSRNCLSVQILKSFSRRLLPSGGLQFYLSGSCGFYSPAPCQQILYFCLRDPSQSGHYLYQCSYCG